MDIKYVAKSIDGIEWEAAVWSNYDNSYIIIKASPVFKNPENAIEWAKKEGY